MGHTFSILGNTSRVSRMLSLHRVLFASESHDGSKDLRIDIYLCISQDA